MKRQRSTSPRALFQKTRPFLSTSALLPLIVVAIAFGALAYRSYNLSERMEQGANMLAMQYADYSADITARRIDAAVRDEIFDAAESWQKIERRVEDLRSDALQQWLDEKPWIVSAIYVPDADPTDSLYVTELTERSPRASQRVTHEFYTASGSVRFTYDPERVLTTVSRHVLEQQPQKLRVKGGTGFRRQSLTTIVPASADMGLKKTGSGFSVTTPLAEPLAAFAVRSSVQTTYVGSGWESQKIIGGLFTAAALILALAGVIMAIRGIRRESEAMQLRAALIANVSHELRTPLSMIRLGAETLSRGEKVSERERTDILSSILREVVHLSHMVENVLDIARLSKSAKPLVFAPVYPDEIVMSVVDNYQAWLESKGFSLELDIDDLIEEQLWDREAVSRAVLNLIDNAVKYSSSEKKIRISLRQSDDLITLEVQDHGAGIPARELGKIFDPYYRAQFSDTETRRGAGLGLTLVQQIVQSHGGTVDVESTPGHGSTFRLLFPKGPHTETSELTDLVNAPSI